jgi:hypothetical protein
MAIICFPFFSFCQFTVCMDFIKKEFSCIKVIKSGMARVQCYFELLAQLVRASC